jgi:hypothetical protein
MLPTSQCMAARASLIPVRVSAYAVSPVAKAETPMPIRMKR